MLVLFPECDRARVTAQVPAINVFLLSLSWLSVLLIAADIGENVS